MNTVTTQPAYGSVEHYADMIRRHANTQDEARAVALAVVEQTANHGGDDGERLARVRNVLAAVEQVLAEIQAAGRAAS